MIKVSGKKGKLAEPQICRSGLIALSGIAQVDDGDLIVAVD